MDTTLKIIKAIKSINSNAQFTFGGDDINTIVWENGTTPISKTDIQNKMAELPTEEQEKQDAINKKTSAKSKLLALGLTEEEIKLTFGI